MKTIMPSSMLDINSEQYYPDLWSPGQCDPVQPPISDIEFREQSVRLGADLCDGLLKGFSYGLDPTQGGGISGLIPLCKAFQAVSKKFQMHPEAKGFFRRYNELERLCRAMRTVPDGQIRPCRAGQTRAKAGMRTLLVFSPGSSRSGRATPCGREHVASICRADQDWSCCKASGECHGLGMFLRV